MRRFLINPLRGVIVILLLILSTLLVGLLTLLGALIAWIIPNKRWHHFWLKHLAALPVLWTDLNKLIMQISSFKKWDVQGSGYLSTQQWYVVIANHTSWLDILVLSVAFNHKIPSLKFFMKKELLWTLPLAGLVCWLIGYPFMERHTAAQIRKNPELKGKDIATTRAACEKLSNFPTSVINFVEGTRFSEEKRQRQQSPYQHLLKPKAGGTAIVVQEMRRVLSGIVNVTVHYKKNKLTLWQFACGDFNKIQIRYDVLPITQELIGNYYEDRQFRASFQQWLNNLWRRNDSLIDKLIQDEENN